MDEAMAPLARRAVKCKAWRWLPGMQAVKDGALLCASDDACDVYRMVAGPDRFDDRALWCNYESDLHLDGESDGDAYTAPSGWWMDGLKVPDLTDPATLGCLLHLVREAWGDPRAATAWDSDEMWYIDAPTSEALHTACAGAESEAAALVAALEAAP